MISMYSFVLGIPVIVIVARFSYHKLLQHIDIYIGIYNIYKENIYLGKILTLDIDHKKYN